jgi:hypothetical protein
MAVWSMSNATAKMLLAFISFVQISVNTKLQDFREAQDDKLTALDTKVLEIESSLREAVDKLHDRLTNDVKSLRDAILRIK